PSGWTGTGGRSGTASPRQRASSGSMFTHSHSHRGSVPLPPKWERGGEGSPPLSTRDGGGGATRSPHPRLSRCDGRGAGRPALANGQLRSARFAGKGKGGGLWLRGQEGIQPDTMW